jgi:hypothetical protein
MFLPSIFHNQTFTTEIMKTNKSSERATQLDRFSLIEVSDTVAANIGGGIKIAVRVESSETGDTATISIEPATRVDFLPLDSSFGTDRSTMATAQISSTNIDILAGNRSDRSRPIGRGFSITIDES